MRPLLSILFGAALPLALYAQGADSLAAHPAAAAARLTVTSPIAGVKVVLDTTLLGTAPVTDSALAPGSHILTFVHPAGNLWIHPASIETLDVSAGASIVREARFQRWAHITSDPYGAQVRAGDSLLGETPLYAPLDGFGGTITLSLPGYADAVLPLSDSSAEIHALLAPLSPGAALPRSPFLAYEQSTNSLPIIATAGVTVIAGVAAAWTKIRADDLYDEYQQTGSQTALDNVRRLDVASGVSLVASQAGLLLLGYLLFSR